MSHAEDEIDDIGEKPPFFDVDPREMLKKTPKKGILKTPSQDRDGHSTSPTREAHFDEMNILTTLHPADKDYGLMKIDEPKTPYNYHSDSEDDSKHTAERVRRVSLTDPPGQVDANKLQKRLCDGDIGKPRAISPNPESDEEETEEVRAKRKAFEERRKKHYDEGLVMKQAKRMLVSEDDEMDTESAVAQHCKAHCKT